MKVRARSDVMISHGGGRRLVGGEVYDLPSGLANRLWGLGAVDVVDTEPHASEVPLPEDLSALTVAQLLRLAADRQIDLAGAKRKAEIVAAIEAHV